MNVLFITSRADIGGGPEHLFQLVKSAPDGARPFIACPDDAPYAARYETLVGQQNILPIPHRAFTLKALRQIIAFVRQNDISVIHSHGKGAGTYSRLCGLMTGRPVVHTFHGYHDGEYSPAKKRAYKLYEKAMARLTRAFICVSASELDTIRSLGIAADRKLHLIVNGVAIPDTISSRTAPPPLQIVAVSRFDYQKNPELLLEIASKLAPVCNAQITVLGTGPRFAAIKAQARELGLGDTLQLVGNVNTPRARFQQAHLFLSTSRWEGLPLAVLEAMSEGVPALVTDVVGNRDIVNGSNAGYLYQTADEAVELIRRFSPDSFQQLSPIAHSFIARNFSIHQMCRETYTLLASAAKNSDTSAL